jgi:hypothetical protein
MVGSIRGYEKTSLSPRVAVPARTALQKLGADLRDAPLDSQIWRRPFPG